MEAAFSTARRARVSRRSSTGSSVPPASIASRRRTIARSASSSAMASNRPRISSNSPATERLRQQLEWMTDVEPGGLQMQDAAGVGTGNDRSTGAGNGVDLALTELEGHLRMGHTVGAARAAAQAIVIELDDVGERRQHGTYVPVGALHVAQGGG